MDKISVIIPVYNVEPYIKKCLDSVINQTYTNLEIICINDGSTDNSGKICDEYTLTDKRIRVFHQENQGVSNARNVGLKNFTGQYVSIIDSDDWLEQDMYETLYTGIKNENVSVSVANFFIDTDDEVSEAAINREHISNGVLSERDMLLYALRRDCYAGFRFSGCNKLFSAEIFLNNCELMYDCRLKFGEDILFYIQAVLSDKCTGTYINKPLYHYYQRDTSAVHSASLDIKMDAFIAFDRIIELLENNGYNNLTVWIKRQYCFYAGIFAEKALENNDIKMFNHMRDKMKPYLNDYLEVNREYPDRIRWINTLLDFSSDASAWRSKNEMEQ